MTTMATTRTSRDHTLDLVRAGRVRFLRTPTGVGYAYSWTLDRVTAPAAIARQLNTLDVAGAIDVAPFDRPGVDDSPVIVREKIEHPEGEA